VPSTEQVNRIGIRLEAVDRGFGSITYGLGLLRRLALFSRRTVVDLAMRVCGGAAFLPVPYIEPSRPHPDSSAANGDDLNREAAS
jgi:hypothetical protein